MECEVRSRRGFLKGLAAMVGGLGVTAVLATPAQAGRSRWRGGWGRRSSGRRYWRGGGFYGGGYPGGFYGGYPGGYYGGPRFYGRGYYGAPYVRPIVPVRPYPYNYNYYGPILKRDVPGPIDALRLLEA